MNSLRKERVLVLDGKLCALRELARLLREEREEAPDRHWQGLDRAIAMVDHERLRLTEVPIR